MLTTYQPQHQSLPWQSRVLENAPIGAATLITGGTGVGSDVLALALGCRYCNSQPDTVNADILVCSADKKNISIEDIRKVLEFVSLSPIRYSYRVAIILQAQYLTASAANCLLKALEEPRPRHLFILSATFARQLPATIISRCQIIRCPLPRQAQVQHWLAEQKISTIVLDFCTGAPLDALHIDDDWLQKTTHHLKQGRRINIHQAATDLRREAAWLIAVQKWVADAIYAASGMPLRYFPKERAAFHALTQAGRQRWIALYQRLLAHRATSDHSLSEDITIREILYAYKHCCTG